MKLLFTSGIEIDFLPLGGKLTLEQMQALVAEDGTIEMLDLNENEMLISTKKENSKVCLIINALPTRLSKTPPWTVMVSPAVGQKTWFKREIGLLALPF